MKKGELKRLNRAELLELLLDQTKTAEDLQRALDDTSARMQQELDEANEKLNDREINIREAGSIAAAAAEINHLFESADATVKQYMDNAIAQADRRTREATAEAERILAEAKAQAQRTVAEANAQAQRTVAEADAHAERSRAEAEAYWDEISQRMENFYRDHAWLREILEAKISNDDRAQRTIKREETT